MSNQRYNSQSHDAYSAGLSLLYISISKYEKDWHSMLHAHQCTELFYVIAGHGEFQVEELHFSVKKNDLVIINANVEHTESALPTDPMEYIVLGLEGGNFLLQDGEDQRYCAFSCEQAGDEFLSYMKEILRELEGRKEYADVVAHHLLEVLYHKLMRFKRVSVALQPTEKTQRECINVKRYIDAHYQEQMTLESLAEVVHLNKYYLVHAFAKVYGVSPISYLNQRRIEESRYFLRNTNYSISQIAHILGFSSPNYFTQRFTKAEGVSPREYRKRMSVSSVG